jgi:hypothetical protein
MGPKEAVRGRRPDGADSADAAHQLFASAKSISRFPARAAAIGGFIKESRAGSVVLVVRPRGLFLLRHNK